MHLQEAILRACEEYTPRIQELKDYIISQGNRIHIGQEEYELEPSIDWDFVLTLQGPKKTLEFSQYSSEDPIQIRLGYTQFNIPNYLTPEQLIKKINTLQEDFKNNIEDLVQCVIKVKDLGNGHLQYIGMILDKTDYKNEQEMEYDFDQFFDDESPETFVMLAYHEDGKNKFYTEEGEEIDLDMDELNAFDQAYKDKINDNPTVINDIKKL